MIFCDAFSYFILGEGEEEGRSLEEILFKLIYFAVCRVNCHFWVLCVWIRYILKFYDKTLPPITFWKFKHEKTFIFSRETQGKPKQLQSAGAGAFRHVSKAIFFMGFQIKLSHFLQNWRGVRGEGERWSSPSSLHPHPTVGLKLRNTLF